ncbi:MAG TPA: ATP-binding protein [Gemmatimonadaceae bacterium]|jgi:PAS domain S-box-containing protein|nr:ATP-binding protein [Gemmatimonadaceae bacterium]
MMDPLPQPTSDEIRISSRNLLDAELRPEKRLADVKIADAPRKRNDRDELLATIEELRLTEEQLRLRSEALTGSRNALAEERIKYRELFDFAPEAYLTTDLYGTIRDANVAAGRLLGAEPRSLVGKALHSFFEESARKQFPHQLDQLSDRKKLDDWELWLQPRHGPRTAVSASVSRSERNYLAAEYRWIVRDVTKLRNAEDEIRELIRHLEVRVATGTVQLAAAYRAKDELLVSERRARAEAEAANNAKTDFLALMSHEFRTPLQAIFGYTELLEREIHGPLTDAQRGDLKRIQQSQQHLLGLITAILDFSRIESGQGMEVRVQPTLVNEILHGMEGLIGSQLEPKALRYEFRRGDARIAAQADAAKVQQILLNLLANAIKFTPRGGTIRLECKSDWDHVAIRVVDSGIGIPADKLEAVFEPFVQIREKNARSDGTGLGLAISRRLAVAMGGSLTAASTLGKGSTFTLRLRKAESAQPAA